MADITKCDGVDCPRKEWCYRFTAPSTPGWQAFFTVNPLNKETNECDMFTPNKEYNESE